MKNLKTILVGLGFFLLCCVAVFFYGHHKGYKKGYDVGYHKGYTAGYNTPHPADTVFITETIPDPYPVPVEVTPAGYELAPVGTLEELKSKVDSLSNAVHDTTEIYVPVQIERKEYRKPNYYAVVTGYHPSLDYIETYNEKEYITNYIEKPAPRWRLSITAGPGVVYNGKFHFGAAAAVGISYNF